MLNFLTTGLFFSNIPPSRGFLATNPQINNKCGFRSLKLKMLNHPVLQTYTYIKREGTYI